MNYYTIDERDTAIASSLRTINLLTEACTEFTRGVNDCLALLIEYDYALRGDESKARDYIDFRWDSTRDFLIKLHKSGKSIEGYAKYCNYEIVQNKRPILGDIAFNNGAMLCDGYNWVSSNEDNTGIYVVKQKMFLERRIPLIARPIRS